jgi:hypothetical protein
MGDELTGPEVFWPKDSLLIVNERVPAFFANSALVGRTDHFIFGIRRARSDRSARVRLLKLQRAAIGLGYRQRSARTRE